MAIDSKKIPDKSIRKQLLCWLLSPLCALWLISTVVAYYLSAGFANDAYDRELLNSADSVAARLRSDGIKIWVDLPPAAQAILRHNDKEKFYYQVIRQDGTRVSGDSVLPGPFPKLESQEPVFRYAKLDGNEVRVARIRVEVPNIPEQTVFVQAAETLNSRRLLAGQILLSIVLPQILLIVLGALAVSLGVDRGLEPHSKLEKALAKRSRYDLTPVSTEDVPREIYPLVLAINDLLSRLLQDIDAQHRFVSNAAHQLRTPVAGLKTYIYAAKLIPSEARLRDLLEKIDTGSERISRLTSKLLALARAEPGNANRKLELVDLNFIVSETTTELCTEALAREIELKFEGTNTDAIVKGDSSDLTELTANLVENAVLYTQRHGRVDVRVTNTDHVTLTIEDNGPGIPAEERELVFERFYRILGTEASGSGLGLAIVNEIANAHHAEIMVEAGSDGIGTKLSVIFPKPSDIPD